jgi:uncharacterized protein YjiK
MHAQSSPYDFDQPDAQFALEHDLREISGLTVLDDTHLGAIQDEKGKLYIIDSRTGEVVDDPKFEKDGDYEALERVDDRVFVLRSDGTLYEIEDWKASDLKVDRHKTALSSRNDTEGLAYDPVHNRLLIACKEFPGKGRSGQRAVYAFSLDDEHLSEEPVFTVDLAEVDEALNASTLDRVVRALAAPLGDFNDFKPSAIAIHPITGHTYLLSSVRKALVALDGTGQIVAAWKLSPDLFRQPEGLAFLPDGDLFIANEGAGKAATLLRFAYHE